MTLPEMKAFVDGWLSRDADSRARPEQAMTDDNTSYSVTITRHADGGRATIEWDSYGLLHELLTDIMAEAAKFGWLIEWPELPAVEAHSGDRGSGTS